jgi:hypothetical protein
MLKMRFVAPYIRQKILSHRHKLKKSLEVPMNGFASAVNHTTTDQLAGDQVEQDEWRHRRLRSP